MKYRTLGQELKVSAIGIGCMTMNAGGNIVYGGNADDAESTRTVHRAIELGVTFSTPPKSMALMSTRSFSAGRSRASATSW